MHVRWRIAHEPLHSFDDHQPSQPVAAEGMKDKQTVRRDQARGFTDGEFRLLHVLKEVQGANRVEAAIRERKPIGISFDIFRPPAGVMQVGDLKCVRSKISADDGVDTASQIIGKETASTAYVTYAESAPGATRVASIGDPKTTQLGLPAQ